MKLKKLKFWGFGCRVMGLGLKASAGERLRAWVWFRVSGFGLARVLGLA